MLSSSFIRATGFIHKARRKLRHVFRPELHPKAVFETELRAVLGANLLSAVDVGGAVDLQPHWHKLVNNANLYVYEPHPESYRDLMAKREKLEKKELYHVLNEALSGSGGRRTLYMTNAPTGSTIVEINRASAYCDPSDSYLFPIKEVPLETTTLERSLATAKVTEIDLIKLDIQGAELEVLQGLGRGLLDQLLCFELELHLNDMYVGGTGPAEMMKFINDHGFELLDVRVAREYVQRHGRSGFGLSAFGINGWKPSVAAKAWEFDVVCFRRPDKLLQARDARRLRKLIASYCVYNFFMEAVCLVEEASTMGIFNDAEARRLRQSIGKMQKCMERELAHYAAIQKGFGNLNWGQYMWVGFPTT